jgi:hypothetical protein
MQIDLSFEEAQWLLETIQNTTVTTNIKSMLAGAKVSDLVIGIINKLGTVTDPQAAETEAVEPSENTNENG